MEKVKLEKNIYKILITQTDEARMVFLIFDFLLASEQSNSKHTLITLKHEETYFL